MHVAVHTIVEAGAHVHHYYYLLLRLSIEKTIYYYNYYCSTIPVYENYILLLLLTTVYYSYLLLLFRPVVLRTVEPRLFEALAGIRRPTATDLQRMSSPLHPTSYHELPYVKVQVVHRDFCYGHARSLHARLGASTKRDLSQLSGCYHSIGDLRCVQA